VIGSSGALTRVLVIAWHSRGVYVWWVVVCFNVMCRFIYQPFESLSACVAVVILIIFETKVIVKYKVIRVTCMQRCVLKLGVC
jgi:hypothetical protein